MNGGVLEVVEAAVEARYSTIHSFAAMMAGWEDKDCGFRLGVCAGCLGVCWVRDGVSSTWRFMTSSANFSVEDREVVDDSSLDSGPGSSTTGSSATGSSYSATVWPLARRMGRLSSASAGNGGLGSRDRRLLFKMW